jgi:hypothetical protein
MKAAAARLRMRRPGPCESYHSLTVIPWWIAESISASIASASAGVLEEDMCPVRTERPRQMPPSR